MGYFLNNLIIKIICTVNSLLHICTNDNTCSLFIQVVYVKEFMSIHSNIFRKTAALCYQCQLCCLYCLTSSSSSFVQSRAETKLLTLSIISPDMMASWSRQPKLPTTVLLRSNLGILDCTASATPANGYTCRHKKKCENRKVPLSDYSYISSHVPLFLFIICQGFVKWWHISHMGNFLHTLLTQHSTLRIL